MIRTLVWLLAGLVLGGIIHIMVILTLPALSPTSAWDRVAPAADSPGPAVLAVPKAGEANPLRLDPGLAYAVCRIDLHKGPGSVTGTLPQAFWSVSVYAPSGQIVYSTTNRDGIGGVLDMGLFSPAQTRLLAEQKLEIAEGWLIVEAPTDDDLMVLVRLAPSHPAMRARYEKALTGLRCGNIPA